MYKSNNKNQINTYACPRQINVTTYAEAVAGMDNSPLCLSSASGEGSRPRNSTNTWMQHKVIMNIKEEKSNK